MSEASPKQNPHAAMLSSIAVEAAASTHEERLARIDAALSDARAVLADIPQHTDQRILTACDVLETYGGMPERHRAYDIRQMIERTSGCFT